jgi:hypothetical protein
MNTTGNTESTFDELQSILPFDVGNEFRKKILDVHRSDEWKETKRKRVQTDQEKKNHFQKGNKAASKKGEKLKRTILLKETMSLILAKQFPKINQILDKMAKEQPKKFLDVVLSMAEFIQPRVSRQEVHGEVSHNNILVIGKPSDLQLPQPNQNVIEIGNNLKDDGNE